MEDELTIAIEQLKKAAENTKQRYWLEAKEWQKRTEELQSTLSTLQMQLQDVESQNQRLRAEFAEKSSECDKLQAMNSNLQRTLSQKDAEIEKFVNLNRTLKSFFDQNDLPSAPPQPSYSKYESTIPAQPTYTAPPQPAPKPQQYDQYTSRMQSTPSPTSYLPSTTRTQQSPVSPPQQQPTASKSSLFIRAAKQELTYSDFNQMISEINMYNRHQQTREVTISNVKKLLCPAHRELFDQFLPMISGK